MLRLSFPLVTLGAICAIMPCGYAQTGTAPGGISAGLFAWYQAADFRQDLQTWPPKYGNVTLEAFAQPNTLVATSKEDNEVNYQVMIEMGGRGFRGNLLPANTGASYTVFAVCRRNNSYNFDYQTMSWGFGTQSAYPGFVMEPPYQAQPENNSFFFTPARKLDFIQTYPTSAVHDFRISSLTFTYGTGLPLQAKIASINGETRTLDAGKVLPFNNGWVYLNANAAFLPGGSPQDHDYAEFIVYNRRLSDPERQRIETWLSLKYSLPLTVAVPGGGRYTLDGLTDLWDTSGNFNRNVRGIGRHDATGLDVRQAYGAIRNSNFFLLTIPGSAGFPTDNVFLLVGDKGIYHDEYPNQNNTTAIPGGTRLKRVWHIQNKGVTQAVQLRIASAAVPDGGLSLDTCASPRLLVSKDSTFQTFTTHRLTPAVIYQNPTNQYLFSSYEVNLPFSEGESFITFASVNAPGTPYVADESEENMQPYMCADNEGFHYFLDGEGRPLVGVKGLSNFELKKANVTAAMRVLAQPERVDNGTIAAVLARRLVTISSGALPPNPNITVRYYLPAGELTEIAQPGGTDTWYKREGSADDFLADFSDDGLLNSGSISKHQGIWGEANGVGYIEFRNLGSFSTFGLINAASSLPVKLAAFEVKTEKNTSVLTWKTTEASDFGYFEVERSPDAGQWQSLGRVPGEANSSTVRSYSFTDNEVPDGTAYYRLKLTDLDGTYTYSNVVSAHHGSDGWLLYPNPSRKRVYLKNLSGRKAALCDIRIIDASGKLQMSLKEYPSDGLDISQLRPGIYQVLIGPDNGTMQVRKLFVDAL